MLYGISIKKKGWEFWCVSHKQTWVSNSCIAAKLTFTSTNFLYNNPIENWSLPTLWILRGCLVQCCVCLITYFTISLCFITNMLEEALLRLTDELQKEPQCKPKMTLSVVLSRGEELSYSLCPMPSPENEEWFSMEVTQVFVGVPN